MAEDHSIHRVLQDRADEAPEAFALLAPGRGPMTYGALWTHVRGTVAALNGFGIGVCDRVAIVLPNGPEMAVGFLAVSAAAACAPLNPTYRAREFERAFEDLHPRALIVEAGASSPARDIASRRGIPMIEMASPMDAAATFSLKYPEPVDRVPKPIFASENDVALVLHTSGTSSRPKLVPLTHANLWHSARNIASTLRLSPSDRCLNVMPLFHVHGLIAALLSSITAGGSVVCAPDFLASRFFDWLDEFKPSWYTAVPTVHQAIARRASQHQEVVARSSLRFIRSSSSALAPRLMNQVEETFNVPVVEAYGMTEAAHQVASNPLPPAVRKPGSVGAAAGPDVAVMDEFGRILDAYQDGDIVVRGPNVMAGYTDTQTSDPDTFVDGWFRTGDRGWIDSDGYLFLNGRTKEIINRGGEKISPREIDDALMEHPAVAAALGFAVPDARVVEEVAAAVVLHDGASVSERELREFAAARLADYKIPRRIIFMDALPTGPTGKPQRIGMASKLGLTAEAAVEDHARPSSPLDKSHEKPDFAHDRPRNSAEAILCDLWAQVLDVPAVGIHDNFFALGGDSILAVQVLSRLREAIGVDISIVRFLDAPTVAEMAAWLPESSDAISVRQPDTGTLLRSGAGDRPLSHAQQSIWILSRLQPDSAAYNITMSLRLDGGLDTSVLRSVLNEIVRRHEILRTTFPIHDGKPVQRIASSYDLALDVVDLSALGAEQQQDEASRLARATSDRPFDLVRGPLLRVTLIRLDTRQHLLQLDLHHIAADAWSRRILVSELVSTYNAFASGEAAPRAELPCQYADFAEWQKQLLAADRVDRELSFWKTQLAGAPEALTVPLAGGRPAMDSGDEDSQSIEFPADFVARIRDFSRRHRVSPFMTLTAALDVLLRQLTGEVDIVLGVPVAGRSRPEFEKLIGCFVNFVLLRTDVSGNPTFAELLVRVRDSALTAYAHQELPFDYVVDALRPQASLERTPLFNVMFDFVDDDAYAPATGGDVLFTPLDVAARMPNVDLMLYVKQHREGLNVRLHYRSATLAPECALDLLRRFQRLLEQAIEAPDALVLSYSTAATLTAAERRQILVEWNDTRRDYPRKLVHQLFEEQAARNPNAVAVVCGPNRLTYAELNRRANRLAHHLRAQGVGPDILVGLCVERSLEMVVGLLGILKAGGGYVPLDPGYPPAHLSYMLADAGPPVVLTQQHLLAGLPRTQAHIVCLDGNDGFLENRDENLDLCLSVENLAYVIYTSGSTGKPKGAMNTHRAVANRLLWAQETFQLGPTDAVLQKTPFSFDVSVWELFLPLVAGVRLVMARPEGHQDNAYLNRLLRDEQITTIHFVPPMLDMFLDEAPVSECVSLRRVIVSGEELRPELQAKFFLRSRAQLFNLYGPTEAAVDVTSWRCNSESSATTVPIGRPIANTRIYILDRQGNPVPVGVPGELHIGGVAVGRGYWRQPELTAKVFIRDGFCQDPEARMYKTGDRARYLPDGNIEFLGRLDHQMKIRGIRIEPGEIEAAILQHRAVEKCLVTIHQTSSNDQLLTAYVVVSGGADVRPEDLRSFLQSKLPQSMIPAAYVALDAFPLTPNGKVDRKALPRPEPLRNPGGFVAARDRTESTLIAIWESLLSVSAISTRDNFFDLGGHSLAAIRVFDQIEKLLGLRLPPSILFRASTVEELAALIRSRAVVADGALAAIQPCGTKTPFFCVHGQGGNVVNFRDLGTLFDRDQPVYGVQARGVDGQYLSHVRVEDMASHYVAEIRRVQSVGPYCLGGWSLGGVIALEMARQLVASGQEVGLLAFLDAPALGAWKTGPISEAYRLRLSTFATAARKHAKQLAGAEWEEMPHYLKGILRARLKRVKLDASYRLQKHPLATSSQDSSDVGLGHVVAMRRYRPLPYDGSAVLFRTTRSLQSSRTDGTLGWGGIIKGGLQIVDIPGDHRTMLHPPHVQVLVDRLNDCLKAAHQAARSTCEDHLRTNRFGAWPDSAILSSGRDSNAGLPQAELENVAGGFLDNLENTKATAG